MTAPAGPAPSRAAGPLTTRRRLLGYGAGGAALAASAAAGLGRAEAAEAPAPAGTPGVLDVYINEGMVPMVDGTLVAMRGFGERPTTGRDDPRPSLTLPPTAFLADGRMVPGRVFPEGARVPHHGRPEPGPALPDGTYRVLRRTWASFYPRRTILAESGATVRLRVHNTLDRDRHFAVQDGPDVPVPAGASVLVEFAAPAPGTYVYSDPSDDGVQRVLGLYGVLLVVPRDDPWRISAGGVEFERQWLWICHAIDPEWGRRAREGELIDPSETPPLPRYFTLNDRSGFAAVAATPDEQLNAEAHEDALPSGSARLTDCRDFSLDGDDTTVVTGQVLRLVNTGCVIHQLHWHGNHVWTVRHENDDLSRSSGRVDEEGQVRMAQWEDVVELDPLDRKDVVLPLRPPPDATPRAIAEQDCDWHYPMHCHAEMSQTAGGGVYPGGLTGDWILAAPARPTGGA